MDGQINLANCMNSRPKHTFGGCTGCVCRNCLYWWSQRCPFGGCWDDYRAIADPYNKAHPAEPARTWWSDWNKPGEQEHWCRGGINYPVYHCSCFVKYQGQQVKTCLKANVSVYQGGYIECCLIENYGCEKCYEEFMRRK